MTERQIMTNQDPKEILNNPERWTCAIVAEDNTEVSLPDGQSIRQVVFVNYAVVARSLSKLTNGLTYTYDERQRWIDNAAKVAECLDVFNTARMLRITKHQPPQALYEQIRAYYLMENIA